jgi:hypothetical protein
MASLVYLASYLEAELTETCLIRSEKARFGLVGAAHFKAS